MPKQIARHAPYLRRYARALTGGQEAGDALVRSAMESLLHNESALDADLPLRTALYQVLQHVWRDGKAPETTAESAADRRLQTLDPSQRSALLLVGVEGFTPAEAAQIQQVSPGAFETRLAKAEAEIERQLVTSVLIIEDEPIIALDLTRLVRELGHSVIGTAATRTEAVELASSHKPGLVLADVQLADGSNGIDAAADILKQHDLPIIFITAFPEHLLTGERPEPAFLITKPFREEAVKALIAQALFFHQDHALAA